MIRLLFAAALAVTAACSLGQFDDLRDRAWADTTDQPDGIDGEEYPIAIAALATDRPGLHAVALAARPPGLATLSYDRAGSLESRGVVLAEVSVTALDTTRASVVAATTAVAGADGPVVVGDLGDRGALLLYDARTGVVGPALRRVIEGSACGTGLTDLGRHMAWTVTDLGVASAPDLIVSAGTELLAFRDLTPDGATTTCLRCTVETAGSPRTIQAMVAADFDPASAGDEIALGLADPAGLAPGSVEIFRAGLIELHDVMGAPCFSVQSGMASIPPDEGELDFGAALAVGQGNDVEFPELAVAAPAEQRVYVFRDMSPSGPSGPPQIFAGVAASASFATAMAFADLDGDGRDELAAGDPGADVGGVIRAGAVSIYAPGGEVGPAVYELSGQLHDARPETDQHLGRTIAAVEFDGSTGDTDVLLTGADGELFTFFRALVTSTDPRE